jgi:iron complex transport system substrate-binding protein
MRNTKETIARPRRWFGGQLLFFLALSCSCGNAPDRQAHPSAGAASAPLRIVSLVPNATEILFALGAGDRVIAVSAFTEYPAEARRLAIVGDYQGIQVEKVIALRPDLIIGMPTSGNRPALDRLKELGYPTRLITIAGIADIYTAIQTIAEACGLTERGRQLAGSLRQQIAGIRESLQQAPKIKILFVVDRSPLIVAGKGSYIDELMAIAGGDNVAGDSDTPYPQFSFERVIARAPEVIVDTGFMSEPGPESMVAARQFWARYPSLPAVSANRLIFTKDSSLFVPGPRIIEGLKKLCRYLHPQVQTGFLGTESTASPEAGCRNAGNLGPRTRRC